MTFRPARPLSVLVRLLLALVLCVAATVARAQTATLTVNSTPITGVTVTNSPADVNNVTSGQTNEKLTYSTIGALPPTVQLTAPLNFQGEVFDHWETNGASFGTGVNAITIQFSTNTTVTAVYNTPNVALLVTSSNPDSGVTISASPADINNVSSGPTPVALTYANLTAVTLSAPATAGGNAFSHWVIGGTSQPNGKTAVTFTLNGQTSAQAVYLSPVTLTVQSVNPTSGISVTASPADSNGKSSGSTAFTLSYAPATVVTLTAPATSPTGGAFVSWTLNGIAQTAGQTTLSVPMVQPATAVATYATPNFTITSSAVGTHGTISPAGTTGLALGASQQFTAAPAAGWSVKSWTLDGTVVQTGGLTYTVSNVTANHTLTVSFSVITVLHPADTNKDGRITIGEVTAYGLAWKKGTAWPNTPSPIPQTYITNAIMLWKSGEAYANDPSQAAPATWVPAALAPQVALPNATVVKTGSSVSHATRQADGTNLVKLVLTPPTGTVGYTIEEHVPRGAKITWISAGGALGPDGFTLRWGPFMDSAVRIVSYRVAGKSGVLNGQASFNGSQVTTTGDRNLGGVK